MYQLKCLRWLLLLGMTGFDKPSPALSDSLSTIHVHPAQSYFKTPDTAFILFFFKEKNVSSNITSQIFLAGHCVEIVKNEFLIALDTIYKIDIFFKTILPQTNFGIKVI